MRYCWCDEGHQAVKDRMIDYHRIDCCIDHMARAMGILMNMYTHVSVWQAVKDLFIDYRRMEMKGKAEADAITTMAGEAEAAKVRSNSPERQAGGPARMRRLHGHVSETH